jgi:hypothetical protein
MDMAIIIDINKAIVAEKQRLRDITNQVNAVNTLEELKLMEIK